MKAQNKLQYRNILSWSASDFCHQGNAWLTLHVVNAKILRPRRNAKALKATTKAKAWTSEVKAFKRMVGAEIKIHSTYDSLTG